MKHARPLLEVHDLSKHYAIRRRFFSRSNGTVRALDGVSLSVAEGETLALVGESGSGKSTFGRLLLRLEKPTGGKIWFDGRELTSEKEDGLEEVCRKMQIVFQDPSGSLNPRIAAGDAISEVLRVHRLAPRGEMRGRAIELLEKVGLAADDYSRLPHEFSGGQRQRIGIARAIATEPRFLVADEPISALDVSVQAQILGLLERLKAELGLTLLLITHNLAVVEKTADRIAVLYRGLLQEEGPTGQVFESPLHPYTRALLEAIPSLDRAEGGKIGSAKGALPLLGEAFSGCLFHPRCPLRTDECVRNRPEPADAGNGRRVACWAAPDFPPE